MSSSGGAAGRMVLVGFYMAAAVAGLIAGEPAGQVLAGGLLALTLLLWRLRPLVLGDRSRSGAAPGGVAVGPVPDATPSAA